MNGILFMVTDLKKFSCKKLLASRGKDRNLRCQKLFKTQISKVLNRYISSLVVDILPQVREVAQHDSS